MKSLRQRVFEEDDASKLHVRFFFFFSFLIEFFYFIMFKFRALGSEQMNSKTLTMREKLYEIYGSMMIKILSLLVIMVGE